MREMTPQMREQWVYSRTVGDLASEGARDQASVTSPE